MKRLSLLLFLCCSGIIMHAQNLFDLEHSLPYVHHLISQKEHAAAEQELNRLMVQYPDRDTLMFLQLVNYKKQENKSGFFSVAHQLPGRDSISETLAAFVLKESFEQDSIRLVKALLPRSVLPGHKKQQAWFYLALYEHDTIRAVQLLAGLNAEVSCPAPAALLVHATHLRHKSPGLASLFSVVVPGSGKVYAGQWKDGLISFLVTGVLAFQAWHGFYLKGTGSVYGWIFTGAGSLFYLGNIYGAHKAAGRYNKKQLENLRNEIKQRFACLMD